MFNAIRSPFHHVVRPSESKPSASVHLMQDVERELSGLLPHIKVTDTPVLNAYGMSAYKVDGNGPLNRRRRVETAKELGLSLTDAPFDINFVEALAFKVGNDEIIYGQCAELASLAACRCRGIASARGFNVYVVQIPDVNHTVTLISKNRYRGQDRVDWAAEFKAGAVVVDLWQAALPASTDRATAHSARSDRYTASAPLTVVQCRVR